MTGRKRLRLIARYDSEVEWDVPKRFCGVVLERVRNMASGGR